MTFPKMTRTKNSMKMALGNGTSLSRSSNIQRLLPSERAHGRLMRAPDGHGVPTDDAPAPDAGGDPSVDAAAADNAAGEGGADDKTTGDADPADEAPQLTAEEQEAADKAAAEKAEADKAEFNPHGAPEGDYELSMPDGVELDKAMLDAFVPVAKELDLSGQGAQKLTEFFIEKVQPQIAEAFVKGIEADVENQKAQFEADTKALIAEDAKADKPEDRVFDGKNVDAVTQVTARALDRFGSPELREFLNASGLGNHPELVKSFYKIGKLIGEDNDFARGGNVPQPKSREAKYYG